jgi:elongator complex protein 3
MYKEGKFRPYSDDEMIKVLTEIKKIIPRWARIMRVQREISSDQIIAGPKLGNLRQIVQQNLKKQNISCKCIRCREAGLSENIINIDDIKLHRENYDSSQGHEVFLSYDDSRDKIFGFLRLRKPSDMAHRSEVLGKTCIVREIHVYGKSLKLGTRDHDGIQHLGLGKNLVSEAEKISKEEFDANKLLVISAVGTREYYRKLGYVTSGPYMSKDLK